jgi:hypothetical protein
MKFESKKEKINWVKSRTNWSLKFREIKSTIKNVDPFLISYDNIKNTNEGKNVWKLSIIKPTNSKDDEKKAEVRSLHIWNPAMVD